MGKYQQKRQLTPEYIFFYVLFSQDTWRILIGIIVAVICVPLIATPEIRLTGLVVVYGMVATIGYSVSGWPGRKIAQILKKMILRDKMPRS